MKRIVDLAWHAVAVIAASSAIATTSFAADVPSVPVPPVFTWTGFYVGAHVGAAVPYWDASTRFTATNPRGPGFRAATFPGPSGSDVAVLGGFQAGYNWQYEQFVVGPEGDISLLDSDESRRFDIPARALVGAGLGAITGRPDGFESRWNREVEWLATARARLGYIVRPDWLLYVTGGMAFGDLDTRVRYKGLVDRGNPRIVSESVQLQSTEVGFAVGAGTEMRLWENVSAKVEYLYVDLGELNGRLGRYLDTPCCVQDVRTKQDLSLHTARIGLNYQFSSY